MCSGCGGTRTLYDETPADATEGSRPALLTDKNGRLYVRLGDRISVDYDSIRVSSVVVGTEANAWDAATVAADGASAEIDLEGAKLAAIFGTSSAAVNLAVEVSQDGDTWYDSGTTIAIAGAGDFYQSFETGAAFLRLVADGAATITATVGAK